ncbi:MAG: dockerin type I repeat-containing protein [Proteobacteria bacterium]|nr:dockerin type I repeat-containing protein [Pseudomonadota bacterium]
MQNVQESQDIFRTYIDVEIGTDFTGMLPDNIASIAVTGPGGLVPGDLSFSGRIFSKQITGSPALGLYTFTAISSEATGSQTATATDAQTVNRAIPFADPTKFSPADGTVISTKTPTFSWQQISYSETTVYYRLEIRDVATNTQLYLSPRRSNMSSFTIPAKVGDANLLQPGLSYKWRVRTSDSDSWVGEMNRSNSAWVNFTTASPLQHASPPAINFDGYGVVTYSTDTSIFYDTSVIITDLDGIAFDGFSHTVTMSTPAGNVYTLDYYSATSSTTATYTKYIDLSGASPESGDFTFTVTDPAGNAVSLADALTRNPLPVPDMTSYLPMAGSVVPDTTPTFTWAPVPGAYAYRVRIYNMDATQTIWTSSYYKQTSYTMPPGVLAPNKAYRYRIYARDGSNPIESDNVSVAPNHPTSAIPFTTGARTDSPYISLSDGVSTYTSMGGVRQTRLSFYILVYDAQGVPGNIRSVRVIFPSGHQEPLYYDLGNSDNSSIRGAYTSNPDLPPEPGQYRFIAEDRDGHIYSTSEELTVSPIGYPALTSLRPLMNAVTNDTAVDFDWEDVPEAAFYRLRIYDVNYNQVLSRSMTESGYALPAGFLKPGSLYRYKVNTFREFSIDGMDNFSLTVWGNSDMPSFLTGPVARGTSSPAIDLSNGGVYLDHMGDPRTGNSMYRLNFDIRITDPDGIPANIASVRVTYPDGVTTQDLRLDSVVSSTQANYYTRVFHPDPLQDRAGNYTFTVTDFDGNSVQATDNLIVTILPFPVNLSPGAGAVVVGTKPTIRWDPVPGASWYRVRIYDGWDTQIYRSNVLTTNSFTIPDELLLQMNTTYSYTVYAYREPTTENLSNRSLSDYGSVTERRHFTTSATHQWGDVDGNGLVELADGIAALQVVAGMAPTVYKDADVDQDGKIGLQEAIYILQMVSGVR